jgi:hypothetical protein
MFHGVYGEVHGRVEYCEQAVCREDTERESAGYWSWIKFLEHWGGLVRHEKDIVMGKQRWWTMEEP